MDKEQFTLFYRKSSPFSQFYPALFEVDGITYNCAEQYMMHQKALLFNDYESAEKIMNSHEPVIHKRVGRNVKNFNADIWNTVCEEIVKRGNKAKFSQNPDLKMALLETSGTTLVEASPYDRKWGIGLSINNPKAYKREKWNGENLLGKILTEVREELKI